MKKLSSYSFARKVAMASSTVFLTLRSVLKPVRTTLFNLSLGNTLFATPIKMFTACAPFKRNVCTLPAKKVVARYNRPNSYNPSINRHTDRSNPKNLFVAVRFFPQALL